MITVFENLSDHTPHYFEINEVLLRIKKCVNQQTINEIRKQKTKEQRDRVKRSLRCICFSGEFSKRANEALIKHSGFMCLDFDGIENAADLAYWKQKIKADKHTYTVFVSPSDKGLKAIWRVPECATNDEHNRRFDAIAEYWKDCKYFDLNVKGVNRICYESSDPNLVINEKAEVFEGIAPEVEIKNTASYVAPAPEIADDYTEEAFKRIVTWFEKSHNLNRGNRDKGAFMFASAVADYLSESVAYYRILNYIMMNVEQASGDAFTESDAHKCIRQAYKATPMPTKLFDIKPKTAGQLPKTVGQLPKIGGQLPKQDGIQLDSLEVIGETEKAYNLSSGKTTKWVAKTNIKDGIVPNWAMDTSKDDEKTIFWYVTPRGAIKIDYFKLQMYLEAEGFYRYHFAEGKINFVRINDNIIESVQAFDIKNFVLNKLREWGEQMAFNALFENSKFEDKYLSVLSFIEPKFLTDGRHYSWFFFQNSAVKVSGHTIEQFKYSEIEGAIWKSSILKRDFNLAEFEGHDFARFVMFLANSDIGRFRSTCSAIGYLLHRFKDPSNARGVIFYDETISDKPTGGTGKTLILQGVGQLREVVIIDGKDYEAKNQFALSRVLPSSNLIVFDDLKKGFKIENMFSKMTTGLTLEKKNKDEVFIPYVLSPKYAFTSNYVLRGETDSFKRRKFEIECAARYGADYQPVNDFGRSFWSDEWIEVDWNAYDSFMVHCCQLYLNEGLITPVYVNLREKKLSAQTSDVFVQWAEANLFNHTRYHRNETYKRFITDEPGAYCKSANMFYDWMREFGEYHGWNVLDATGAGRMYVQFGKVDGEENEVPF